MWLIGKHQGCLDPKQQRGLRLWIKVCEFWWKCFLLGPLFPFILSNVKWLSKRWSLWSIVAVVRRRFLPASNFQAVLPVTLKSIWNLTWSHFGPRLKSSCSVLNQLTNTLVQGIIVVKARIHRPDFWDYPKLEKNRAEYGCLEYRNWGWDCFSLFDVLIMDVPIWWCAAFLLYVLHAVF